jgi:hypothetical protein
LEEIAEYLPYVLAFNPKFKTISVNFKGQEMSYEKENPVLYDEFSLPLEEIVIESRIGLKSGKQSVIKVKGQDWESGFKIEHTDNGRAFMPMNEHNPSLFASFPLLGTEVLGLPFAIHSTKFGIKHERNGIFLGTGTSEVILQNKNNVEEAINALPLVLPWSLTYFVEHRFNIITFYNRLAPKWLDEEWLNGLKLKTSTTIVIIPLVTTQVSAGTPISIAELIIPGEDELTTREGYV